jgi:prepilin-type N-terminal cleavage/methylation domain-containing protein
MRRGVASLNGFTMIELIVVVVILTAVAFAIVPRVMGNEERAAEAEVRKVENFLTSVATRSVLSGQAMAIVFEEGRLSAQTLRAMGDAADFTQERRWIEDGLIIPVRLDRVEVSDVIAGSTPVKPGEFRIDMPSGAARPSVSLLLESERTGKSWRVDLASDAVRAYSVVIGQGEKLTPIGRGSVDLDDAGLTETPW